MRREPWALEQAYLDLVSTCKSGMPQDPVAGPSEGMIEVLGLDLAEELSRLKVTEPIGRVVMVTHVPLPCEIPRPAFNAYVEHRFNVGDRQRDRLIREMDAAGLIERREGGEVIRLLPPDSEGRAPFGDGDRSRLIARGPDDDPLQTLPMLAVKQLIEHFEDVSPRTARRRIQAWEEAGLIEVEGRRPHKALRVLVPWGDFPASLRPYLAYLAEGFAPDGSPDWSLPDWWPEDDELPPLPGLPRADGAEDQR